MDILYLLIPLSLVFVALIALVFLWAVKSGQFEDMEGPAHRILMDDDLPESHGAKPDNDAH
ncbi:MAG: cbb3-type cytochrome oxidase assembly protein CcoS [Pseudomonadota bacterium]